MHSLFDALLAQHVRQLAPVRCAHSTIAQLHRYFEEVVLENNLNALVIESLPLVPNRSARETARVRQLARSGRRTFFFLNPSDSLNESLDSISHNTGFNPVLLPHQAHEHANEHFVVIADARFSALLATVRNEVSSDDDEVVWSFEPDVVYSALEYLMARVRAEQPYHASSLANAVRTSMPKATSLQLTLGVMTKLALLLQEQAGREIAVNRIANTIRDSLELGVILQKTVSEVGAALNVACCALRVEAQAEVEPLTYSYFAGDEAKLEQSEVAKQLELISLAMAKQPELSMRDGSDDAESESETFPFVVVPLIVHERFIGVLKVTDNDPARTWQDNEILLLRTVADQVAVAINHAALFAQTERQALTDPLTGCYNRRSFEMQLDRELQMAVRLHQPLSLLMLDLDKFKELNDSVGHDAGDSALRQLADCFREELRGVDTASRFGGDEFALILPQAYSEGAFIVADRLRRRIHEVKIRGFGRLAASIGIAAFPEHASSRSELIVAADAALYSAKRAGRNRVAIVDLPGPETLSPANQDSLSNLPQSI